MFSEYLTDSRPSWDDKITAFVEEQGASMWGGIGYDVAIEFNGSPYRHITCEGLGEYVSFDQGIQDLGLPLKKIEPEPKGYDGYFLVLDDKS